MLWVDVARVVLKIGRLNLVRLRTRGDINLEAIVTTALED
jgi:hypothetical protein